MTVLDARSTGAVSEGVVRPPRSADATTILAIFVALQFVLPSRLALNYLPMSLSPATARRARPGRAVAVHADEHDARRSQGPQPGPIDALRLLLRARGVVRELRHELPLDRDERGLADTTLVPGSPR